MKKFFVLLSVGILACQLAIAQGNSIPSVDIKTLEGRVENTKDIRNDGSPMIISFWATWCKPCINELNAINDMYEDMVEETGVRLIAISIDDSRTVSKVAPFINGQDWELDVFLDTNGDLKRAMNVNLVPHTFLVNGDREVISQHTSYAPGDENKLFELVKKAANDAPVH